MTLYQIINTLKQIALTQPNVKSATDGSVYEVMNANPSVKYNVVHFSQTTHQSDEEFDYYGLNIFYISRLEDSLEDNRLQIQSIGKEILDNIIRTFCENWNIEFPTITYYPFTQKFADLCAGAYCNVRLEVPKEIICADDFIGEIIPSDKNIRLQDISITITQNGLRVITPAAGYDGIGEITINTEVPQELNPNLEYKEVEYTQNGEFSVVPGPGYDGIESVAITVDVPTGQTINNQYKSDYLTEANFDFIADDPTPGASCLYELSTGYTFDSGYTGLEEVSQYIGINASGAVEFGKELQKLELSSTSFTENSAYTSENGWSAVTVNVPSDYNEGYADGEADQKAKLDVLYVEDNGTYTREDGYYMVIVDVPHTGYTQQDLDDAYNRGYQDGLEACQHQPVTATSITLNVASSITDSGLATTTVNPSGADVDLSYSSSDTTKAVIDNDGNITVLDDGQVTFCVTDSISNLSDCKTVTVSLVDEEYLTFVITEGGAIKWKSDTTALTRTIEYKKNNGSWSSITSTTGGTNINVAAGDIVKFRGNNATYGNNQMQGCSFSGTTAKFYLEKNIMSLISKTNYRNITTVSSWAFYQLFEDCTGLTSAANLLLPATNLGSYCYRGLFTGCGNLATPPTLPATALAYGCYEYMFDGCSNLATAPALPATTLGGYCYGYMFRNCTKLTTPPSLPATSLQPYCYAYMFYGCTGLTTAPTLPATTLQNSCYRSMFYGCTKITTAPVLSAATLVNNCYRDMFNGCSKLNSIKCLATNISATYCTRNWVSGVASSGTFKRPSSMTSWSRGASGIPSNWTVQNA